MSKLTDRMVCMGLGALRRSAGDDAQDYGGLRHDRCDQRYRPTPEVDV